jgi:O-antigen/teichoic acid export membrane protein
MASGLKVESAETIANENRIFTDEPAYDIDSAQNVLTAAKGGSIAFAGKLFEYVVRFGFSVVLARSIGAEQYGLYTLGLTVVPIASMMALLGLQTGMVRFLAPAIKQKDEADIWGIIQVCSGIPAFFSLIFAFGLFLLSDPIAIQAFHEPHLAPVLRLVSFSIPLDALAFIAYVIIISFKRPEFSVLANNIILPLSKLFLTIGFLAIGLGVLGAVSAHVIASAIGLVLIIYFVNLLFPLRRSLRAARRNTRELLRYSLPVHAGWVFSTVRGTLETLVLGFVGLTVGVGVFSIAQRLSTLGTLFYLSVGNISTPIIAILFSQGDIAQLNSFYRTTTKWVVMFNLPLFLTLVIFARPLLSIFGSDFTTGTMGLIILAVGNLVYTGTGIGQNILDMTNHTKYNSANSAFMIIITILLDLLLIPRWGVIGAALASAASTVIINLVCLIEVFILLKMLPYDRSFFKPIIAGLIASIITYLLSQHLSLGPFFLLVVGGIILWGIYALVLYCLGFSKEDILVGKAVHSRLKTIFSFSNSFIR